MRKYQKIRNHPPHYLVLKAWHVLDQLRTIMAPSSLIACLTSRPCSRRIGRHPLRSLWCLTVGALIYLAVYILVANGPVGQLLLRLRWSSDKEQVNAMIKHTPTGNTSVEAQIRGMPDARPTRCRDMKYGVDAMARSVTIIISFRDHEFRDVEITLTSVFEDADPVDHRLLAEIILVEVASSLQPDLELRVDILKRLSTLPILHEIPVRIIERRSRDQWPLQIGADASETDVVVFVRPGVVVGRGWLAPIVQQLLAGEERTSAVESHINRRQRLFDIGYQGTEDDLIPIPSWSLAIQMRRMPFENSGDRKSNGSESEVPLHRAVPVLRGSAFAVRMSELKTLGGLFDDGLDVEGGGEYLDLSLRLWMCGKGIQQATCSRVGVPDIDVDIGVTSQMNARRLADTWFGSRKRLIVTDATPQSNSTETTMKSQTQNKRRCKDFEWYLKTASLSSLIPPHDENSTHFGFLRARTGYCARIGADLRIDLSHCKTDVGPQPDTVFELAADGRILVSATGQCVQVTTSFYVIVGECKSPPSTEQTWQFTKDGELISDSTKRCATHVIDPDERYKNRKIIMVQRCSKFDSRDAKALKTWTFVAH